VGGPKCVGKQKNLNFPDFIRTGEQIEFDGWKNFAKFCLKTDNIILSTKPIGLHCKLYLNCFVNYTHHKTVTAKLTKQLHH
jgi:hypothetical protein